MNHVIHAAVRRDLLRMEGALRSFPVGSPTRAAELHRAWQTLTGQLHHHHTSEDTLVWPFLKSLDEVPAETLEQMVAEHEAMASAIEAATRAIDALVAAPGLNAAETAADAVGRAYEVTDLHLVHEESSITAVIEAHASSRQWKATERQLRKRPLGQTGEFFAWLQDGASPEEQHSLNAIVPGAVRFVLPRLFGRAYAREVAPVWR